MSLFESCQTGHETYAASVRSEPTLSQRLARGNPTMEAIFAELSDNDKTSE